MRGGQADRWSLIVLGEGVNYSYNVFERMKYEFLARNKSLQSEQFRSTHKDIKRLIAEMGRMQGKYVSIEEEIEGKRIDVSWRRIPRGMPYAVFEVCIGGDLYADLVKLKHAVDMWNSIAVLVTTEDKVEEARKWVEGAFHEVAQNFRILSAR
jgi:predicted RNA-binding protein